MGRFNSTEAEYISRAEYLDGLQGRAVTALDGDDRNCLICSNEMLTSYGLDSGDDFSERPVILHDNHIVGEECARIWLKDRSTCPICRQQLLNPDDEVLPYEEWVDDRMSDYLLLTSLRRNIQTHFDRLDSLGNDGNRIHHTVIEHCLSTCGEVPNDSIHLRKLMRGMSYRARLFQAGELCDNITYETYTRQYKSAERDNRRIFIYPPGNNAALWHWYIRGLHDIHWRYTNKTYGIYAHAFAPRLVMEALEAVRDLDGHSTSIEVIEHLEARLGELGMPHCWQTESLIAFRDDLIAVVLRVASREGLDPDYYEAERVNWVDDSEEVRVKGVVW